MTREEILNIERHTDCVKGILGGGTWLASYLTAHLPDIEAWLRITSLLVGIAVGLITFISIRRRK